MFAKTLIAAAAIAASAALIPVSGASAKTHVNVDIGLGLGGGWGPGYGYGYGYGYPVATPVYAGISCWKGKNIVRWSGFKNVVPVDCSAPHYRYNAWKFGQPYRVTVNMYGNIVKVRHL